MRDSVGPENVGDHPVSVAESALEQVGTAFIVSTDGPAPFAGVRCGRKARLACAPSPWGLSAALAAATTVRGDKLVVIMLVGVLVKRRKRTTYVRFCQNSATHSQRARATNRWI